VNPFEKQTEKDRKALQDRIVASNEDYNAAINKAKKCMELELFKDYKKDFETVAQNLLEIFLELPLKDPVLFAFEVESIRQKIKALRALGIQVTTLANLTPRQAPKPKEEPKK
jgi:hypothetical protein